MAETIALYYAPLASTKLAAAFGFGLAYHVGLVYTNAGGDSFGASAGPSKQTVLQAPAAAFKALAQSASNVPSSGFGVLISDPQNGHAFRKRRPEDYYTQNDEGDEYPHVTAVTGRDLSRQWKVIIRSYAMIDGLKLTYSPITQNSNTVAGMALRRAGITIPFSIATCFAPGSFTRVPGDRPERGPGASGKQASD